MENTYRFLSDEEPTDAQLEALMQDVLEDVKAKAAIAEAKYQLWLQTSLQNIIKQKRFSDNFSG